MEKTKQKNWNIQILGPASPPVSKIKNIHIRKIYVKGNNMNQIGIMFQEVEQATYKRKIFFTHNPAN